MPATLRSDALSLTVLPDLGCHWESLVAHGRGEPVELLRTAPDHAEFMRDPMAYGSFLLAPWSNRIANARFSFEGREHFLRPSFLDGTAIHGDVSTRAFSIVEQTERELVAELDARIVEGWNFPEPLVVRHTLSLDGDRVHVGLSLEHVGASRIPVGLGFHPYFRRRLSERDDDVVVTLPFRAKYPAHGCIPYGPPIPVPDELDWRTPRSLGNPRLDDCFTDLAEPRFTLDYPGSGLQIEVETTPNLGHLVVYAPCDSSGEPADFVAIEPVSCANDAFNLSARGIAAGVHVLAPGERFEVRIVLHIRRGTHGHTSPPRS